MIWKCNSQGNHYPSSIKGLNISAIFARKISISTGIMAISGVVVIVDTPCAGGVELNAMALICLR